MKPLISVTRVPLSLFFLTCFVVAGGCSISKGEHRVVASESTNTLTHAQHVFLGGLVIFRHTQHIPTTHLGQTATPLWTPSTNVVVEALNQLPNFLVSTSKEDLAHSQSATMVLSAMKNLPKSICQAAGITFYGREGVLLNFFPAEHSDLYGVDWRDHFVSLVDGGPLWWSVVYLPKEGTFASLHFDMGY